MRVSRQTAVHLETLRVHAIEEQNGEFGTQHVRYRGPDLRKKEVPSEPGVEECDTVTSATIPKRSCVDSSASHQRDAARWVDGPANLLGALRRAR